MAQDNKDYVFANGGIEGQVTPTVSSSPGSYTSASSAYIAAPTTAQTSTQSNPFPGTNAAITAGVVAVTPFTYNSPTGKIGGP